MFGAITKRATVVLLLVVFFEVFLGRSLEIFSARPDLFLIFIVFWSFVIDRRSAPQLGILLGLIRDIFASGVFGAETASYFLVACLVSAASLKVDRQNFLIQGGACFVFSFLHFCLYALIVLLAASSEILNGNFWWLALCHSLYTAVCASWLIGIFERWSFARDSRFNWNT